MIPAFRPDRAQIGVGVGVCVHQRAWSVSLSVRDSVANRHGKKDA
jgi:hypothetical protein